MRTLLTEKNRTPITTNGSLEEILAGLIFLRMTKRMISNHSTDSVMSVGNLSRGILICEEEADVRVAELLG